MNSLVEGRLAGADRMGQSGEARAVQAGRNLETRWDQGLQRRLEAAQANRQYTIVVRWQPSSALQTAHCAAQPSANLPVAKDAGGQASGYSCHATVFRGPVSRSCYTQAQPHGAEGRAGCRSRPTRGRFAA